MKNRKRAQRIADTQRYVAKQKRIAAMYGYTNLGPEQLGRMKGRSHLDCGRTRCPYCCNPRRNAFIPKGMRRTLQERRREERHHHWLPPPNESRADIAGGERP